MHEHVGRLSVSGGDLNVDLDSNSTVSDFISRYSFVTNNTFIRSNNMFDPGVKRCR